MAERSADVTQVAQAGGVIDVAVPAQRLSSSLLTIGELSGFQVIFDAERLSGLTGPEINGQMPPEQALSELLRGSGLTFEITEGTIRIVELPPQQDSGPLRLDTIQVTGERVTRSLQQTTSSVTVIGPEEVKKTAQTDVLELLTGTPNLTAVEADALPSIRGLQATPNGVSVSNALLSGAAPRVAVIIDGFAQNPTYLNAASKSLFDLEQVEVLRGPQSTLRGRSAMSGAVVMTTPEPSFDEVETQIRAETSYDHTTTRPNYQVGSAVSGPLGEQVAVRLSAERNIRHDAISGFQAGQYTGSGSTEKATEIRSTRLKGKTKIVPDALPELEFDLLGSYEIGRSPAFQNAVQGPNAGFSYRDRVEAFPTDYRVLDFRSRFAGVKAIYGLDDLGEVELVTGFSVDDMKTNQKYNSSTVDFHGIQELGHSVEALWRLDEGGPLTGFIGGSYQYRRSDVDATSNGTLGLTIENLTRSYSAFGDLTYAVTDRLDAHAGGRFLANRSKRDLFFGTPRVTNERAADDVFLPKVGVTYDIAENHTIGAFARRGFGEGGVAFNFTGGNIFRYDPETVWTYEGIYRATALDGRAQFSATAFYNDFKDKQLNVQVSSTANDNEIINQPGAYSYGLELETGLKVTDRLGLNFGLGLLQTRIDDAEGVLVADGNEFGLDPDYTMSLTATWEPIKNLVFDGKAIHVGSYSADAINREGQGGGNYTVFDAGVSYNVDPVDFRLYVRNLTDELVVLSKFTNTARIGRPRTVGLSLDVEF